MTESDVMQALATAVARAGSQRKFALANGFTAGYVSDVLAGKRALGPRILATIGIERVITYQSFTGGDSDASRAEKYRSALEDLMIACINVGILPAPAWRNAWTLLGGYVKYPWLRGTRGLPFED